MSGIATTRNAWVTTPLPEGKLVLENMGGHESLGQPFNYELSLLSTDYAIDLSALLGQPMTVHLQMGTGKVRFFNGIVTAASQVDSDSGFAQYTATLQPWLSLLDYGADCRIFQNTTIPDLVKDVFRRAGFSDFEDALEPGAYQELEYCVQYRESDFHFVSRLMEHEGIYYFFKHDETKHTLVLSDAPGAHDPQPGYETVDYKPPKDHSRTDREHLSSWSVARQMRPGGYASTDFNFKTPRATMLSTLRAPPKQEHADFEVFDYPGDFLSKDAGEVRVKMRLQERHWDYEPVDLGPRFRWPSAVAT